MKMFMVINNTDGELIYKDRNQMYIWKGKNEYRTMNSDEVAMLVAASPHSGFSSSKESG